MKTYLLKIYSLFILFTSFFVCKKSIEDNKSKSTKNKVAEKNNIVSYSANKVISAFSADGINKDTIYTLLNKDTKTWKICVSFPHMKDAYWLGVSYGISEQVKKLGVQMNLV
ncbi:MAG: hypothetical protein ACK5H1_05525 [Tenacibaculum sp.]